MHQHCGGLRVDTSSFYKTKKETTDTVYSIDGHNVSFTQTNTNYSLDVISVCFLNEFCTDKMEK